MHNNYYFLRQLSARLATILNGAVISECFSQNKDELIIRFETRGDPLFLKASLEPGFSHVSFPAVVNRAKRNSVNLFPDIVGYRVSGVRQYTNERSFSIILEEKLHLLFRMHGPRSNIILIEGNDVRDVFRSNITVEEKIDPDTLDRNLNFDGETFLSVRDPKKHYFTFGNLVWQYLNEKGFDNLSREEQYPFFQAVVNKLEQPEYFIIRIDGVPHLSLLPFRGSRLIGGDPIEAANIFFQEYSQYTGIDRSKAKLASTLRSRIKSSENYIEKNRAKLNEIKSGQNYKTWADLIMANLHAIKQGEEKVYLPDFYHEGEMVEIKLKKELLPQANAAIYYRKAKNQHLETQRIEEALRAKEIELDRLHRQLEQAEAAKDITTLRKLMPESLPRQEKSTNPYHEFHHSGFRIWVGKGAQQNDELTLKYGYKEDLWLHAKDVPGSHVIIKYQSGKKFPKDVIERAAQLAAYNSKRKSESLCPVIVTPRKFVRKRKGDPPGTVVVEREEVILVEPKL